MLVLTVQKYSVLSQVYSKEGYVPSFWRSTNAFLSPMYTRGYKMVLEELSRKTGSDFNYGKVSCIWAWASNPFLGYYENRVFDNSSDVPYAVIADIPEGEMVFTDYDKYMMYVEEESADSNFFIPDRRYFGSKCVQGSFLSLKPSNIEGIAGLDCLTGCAESIDAVARRVYQNDISYIFRDMLNKKCVLYYPYTDVFSRLAFGM